FTGDGQLFWMSYDTGNPEGDPRIGYFPSQQDDHLPQAKTPEAREMTGSKSAYRQLIRGQGALPPVRGVRALVTTPPPFSQRL
ncbi:MAG: hypothetical protein ACPGU1_22765, partial [Myxococcota bacterium]